MRPFRGVISRVISPVIRVITISHEPPSRVQGYKAVGFGQVRRVRESD